MGQKTLIYSFVARGTTIVAEYTEFKGNFMEIASQCLKRLPASNDKFTYSCDGHTFNYLVENGYTYCVVAVESAGRQLPIAFLERIKEEFTKKYGGGKAASAVAHSLNREFGSKLKELMQYCMDQPEEINRLARVQAQVSQVKGVMMENIEMVIDRQGAIDGSRFQAGRDAIEKEGMVAEHEDKAHNSRDNHSSHHLHCFVCVPRFPMLMTVPSVCHVFIDRFIISHAYKYH